MFFKKIKTLEKKENALKDAHSRLADVSKEIKAVQEKIVLAERGEIETGDVAAEQEKVERKFQNLKAEIEMLKKDIIEHHRATIDADLARLPNDEAALRDQYKKMEAEATESLHRAERLFLALGGQFGQLTDGLKKLRVSDMDPAAAGKNLTLDDDQMAYIAERSRIISLKTIDRKIALSKRVAASSNRIGIPVMPKGFIRT